MVSDVDVVCSVNHFVRFGINLDNDKMLHKNTENVLNSQN